MSTEPREPRTAAYSDADVFSDAWFERKRAWSRWYDGKKSREWFAANGGLAAKIPELEFPPPPCSICDGELDFDETWTCPVCQVTWDSRGSRGELDQDEIACAAAREYDGDEVCGAERTDHWMGTQRPTRRCRLGPGHEPMWHSDGEWAWKPEAAEVPS